MPGDREVNEATTAALVRLTEEVTSTAERRRLLGTIAAALRRRGFTDMLRPKAAMAWLADALTDLAPRIPIRTLDTLRTHFPGLRDEEIADRLVRNAARATASIGAVGGGVAAVEWVAPPALLTAPALLVAETVAVVAVEVKLIGELHELYGQPVLGGRAHRAIQLLQAWAAGRGVNLMPPTPGIGVVLNTAARQELRSRLLRRFGRNLSTVGPLLTGAAVAAYLNRRATLKLAEEVRRDLATRRPRRSLPAGPA